MVMLEFDLNYTVVVSVFTAISLPSFQTKRIRKSVLSVSENMWRTWRKSGKLYVHPDDTGVAFSNGEPSEMVSRGERLNDIKLPYWFLARGATMMMGVYLYTVQ